MDFEELWNDVVVNEDPPAEVLEQPPAEYEIIDSVARYKIVCSILAFYFHAKYGEPISEFAVEQSPNSQLNFHL